MSFLVAYGLDVPDRCVRVRGRRELRAALDTFRRCGFAVAVLRLIPQETS